MATTGASNNETSYSPFLKTTYVQDYIESVAFGKSALLALLEKDTEIDVVGNKVAWPVITSDGGKRSADAATAFGSGADSIGPGGGQMVANIKSDFWSGSVDGVTAKASMKKEGGFESALVQNLNQGMRKLSKQLGIDVYGTGYGVVGHYVSDDGNATMQLQSGEAIWLQKNDEIFFTNQTDKAAARSSGATLTVSTVDWVNDKVTFTVAIAGVVSGLTAGDRLIMKGDRATGAVTSPSKILGLDAYISATGDTSLNTLDTTADSGMRGQVFDYTSGTLGYTNIHDVVIDGIRATNRMGGKVTHIMMNELRFGDFIKYLTTRQIFFRDSEAKPGFASITLASGEQIVPDAMCPLNSVYFLTLSTLKLGTLTDTVPAVLDLDGNQFLRQSANDGVSLRVGYYAQLICTAPLWNSKAILPSR